MTVFTSPMSAPTYARGRLTVGITGVGTVVVLSILALIIDVPARLFEGQGGTFLKDIPLFALWLGGISLVSLPFEWLGGLAVPAAHRRAHPNADQWVSSWLRGTLLLLSIGSLCGAAIALGGRSGGFVGAIGVAGLTALALLAIQGPLALLIGGLQTVRPPQNALTDALCLLGLERLPLQFVDAKDEGFTGSIVGLPTAETHVLPASWLADLTPQAARIHHSAQSRHRRLRPARAWRDARLRMVRYDVRHRFSDAGRRRRFCRSALQHLSVVYLAHVHRPAGPAHTQPPRNAGRRCSPDSETSRGGRDMGRDAAGLGPQTGRRAQTHRGRRAHLSSRPQRQGTH